MSRDNAGPPAVAAPGSRCPCGLGEPYARCCGRLHNGEAKAATAEQLMRSRFSAFAVADADYLALTWHPSTRPRRIDFAEQQRWTSLEILGRAGGGPFDTEGTVEFRAHYDVAGEPGVMHEHSRFTRDSGRWVYLDAIEPG